MVKLVGRVHLRPEVYTSTKRERKNGWKKCPSRTMKQTAEESVAGSGSSAATECWKLGRKTRENIPVCLPGLMLLLQTCVVGNCQKFDGFFEPLSQFKVVIFTYLRSQCLSLGLCRHYQDLLKFLTVTIPSKCILSKLVNFLIFPKSVLLKLSIGPLSPQIY